MQYLNPLPLDLESSTPLLSHCAPKKEERESECFEILEHLLNTVLILTS